jgi:cobalt-zinc-cadmium efflux system membrane fusion protein
MNGTAFAFSRAMNQHAFPLPPAAPAADRPRRRLHTRRRKLIAAAALALALACAGGLTLALRTGAAPTAAPLSDVPRREGNAIVVSAQFCQVAGLETVAAVSAPLVPLMHTVGSVEFDPTHVAALGTRAAGIVRKVLHVEGDVVQKGELLAEIESAALVEARADLRVAASKKHAATLNLERVHGLFESQLTTGREFEQARSALEQQNALVIAAEQRIQALGGGRDSADTGVSQLRAPVAGVIAERAIAPGQSLGPGHVAFRVGDLDQLWVLLHIFERDIGLVSVGDIVEVKSLSSFGRTIRGTVAHVSDVLDPATRTVDVRVVVPNRERTLRPGQSVKATIRASASARTAVSVPSSAITYVDGAPTVFIADKPTRFVPRRVKLGIDGGDQVEIAEGVRAGERVVSKNVLAIKSEIFR